MSRLIATAVILLVVVVGAAVLLAGRATEQPQVRVEKSVSLANLQN